MATLILFSRGSSQAARFGAFILVATALSLLSCVILFLEYGAFNFGDSDLPPYQPDTPFERWFDFVWFAVTMGAGVFWSGGIFYAVELLSRCFRRRTA
jgi:formate hydrogenlyase subunit 3/multisubunit Na+/H+ antiporter MnhD subunit